MWSWDRHYAILLPFVVIIISGLLIRALLAPFVLNDHGPSYIHRDAKTMVYVYELAEERNDLYKVFYIATLRGLYTDLLVELQGLYR